MSTKLVTVSIGSILHGLEPMYTHDCDFAEIYLETMPELLQFIPASSDTNKYICHTEKQDVRKYTLSHFSRLLLRGNPTAMEILFTPKEHWIETTKHWDTFYSFRSLFLTQKYADALFHVANNIYLSVTSDALNDRKSTEFDYNHKRAAHAFYYMSRLALLYSEASFTSRPNNNDRETIQTIRQQTVSYRDYLELYNDMYNVYTSRKQQKTLLTDTNPIVIGDLLFVLMSS